MLRARNRLLAFVWNTVHIVSVLLLFWFRRQDSVSMYSWYNCASIILVYLMKTLGRFSDARPGLGLRPRRVKIFSFAVSTFCVCLRNSVVLHQCVIGFLYTEKALMPLFNHRIQVEGTCVTIVFSTFAHYLSIYCVKFASVRRTRPHHKPVEWVNLLWWCY